MSLSPSLLFSLSFLLQTHCSPVPIHLLHAVTVTPLLPAPSLPTHTHTLFFFFFFCRTHGMWMFLGQGLNPNHSRGSSLPSDRAGSLTCSVTRGLPPPPRTLKTGFLALCACNQMELPSPQVRTD